MITVYNPLLYREYEIPALAESLGINQYQLKCHKVFVKVGDLLRSPMFDVCRRLHLHIPSQGLENNHLQPPFTFDCKAPAGSHVLERTPFFFVWEV